MDMLSFSNQKNNLELCPPHQIIVKEQQDCDKARLQHLKTISCTLAR
jgi:hypothetical protein